MDLKFTYAPFTVHKNIDVNAFTLPVELNTEGSAWDGNAVVAKARTATLEVFAVDESASVQVRTNNCFRSIVSKVRHITTNAMLRLVF